MRGCVFVTALYDLGFHEANPHRKPIEHYLKDKHCQWVLQLRPLVLFTESRLVERIRQKFINSDEITIIICEFDDLRWHMPTPDEIPYITSTPVKDTLSHLQLQWEKFEMIAKVAQEFPADAYVWADFGLGAVLHDVPESYPEMAMLGATYPVNKFTCTVINPVTPAEFDNRKTYYERWRYRVAGGFWSVGRNVMPEFSKFVRREIAWLRLEHRTPTDEDILGRFVYQFPELCRIYFGDYGSLVANRVAGFIKYDTEVAAQAMHKAQMYRPEYIQNMALASGITPTHESKE